MTELASMCARNFNPISFSTFFHAENYEKYLWLLRAIAQSCYCTLRIMHSTVGSVRSIWTRAKPYQFIERLNYFLNFGYLHGIRYLDRRIHYGAK